MKSENQIKVLRNYVRFLLPEYEAHAGGIPPEEREMVKKHASDIRKFLRNTTPKKIRKSTDIEIALTGPQGSGKTVLLRHIEKLLKELGCEVTEPPRNQPFGEGEHSLMVTPLSGELLKNLLK